MKTFAISIPKPCHEDWNKMTPDAKGAFCGSCQKSVYDFSNKTDEEIISVFEKKGEDKVCGRFAPAQLSRPVVSFGKQNSTNRLAIFAYALMLVFGAALFNGIEAFGQTVKGETKRVEVMGKMAVRTIQPTTVADNDTAKQKSLKPPTVCGTKTIVDNRIMTLGQVAIRETPPTKIVGDTTIKPVNNDIDTLAVKKATKNIIDTVEPILSPQNISYVTGGISYTEIKNVAPLLSVLPTGEKTEDKPVVVSEMIIPSVDSLEVRSAIVPESNLISPPDLEIKVSPNPSSGIIILSYNLETAMPVRIDLFDITGKKVKTLTQTGNQYSGKYNVSYNISDLPNGIYMATLLTNDRKSNSKIILSK
jgi:hypothetical protein